MVANVAGAFSRPSILARARTWLSEMAEEWERITVFRRTYEELNNCSDRRLQDMGLTRAQIIDVAKEAAWGVSARD